VVEVLDQNNERLVGTAVSVTVGLGSNPSGADSRGDDVNTTTGLAVFSDLAIDKRLRIQLVASVSGVVRATSAFDVIVGLLSRRDRLFPSIGPAHSGRQRYADPSCSRRRRQRSRDRRFDRIFTASAHESGRDQATTDNGDGTYTARFVADGAGTALTIGASVNGAAVTRSSNAHCGRVHLRSAGTSASPVLRAACSRTHGTLLGQRIVWAARKRYAE